VPQPTLTRRAHDGVQLLAAHAPRPFSGS